MLTPAATRRLPTGLGDERLREAFEAEYAAGRTLD
jgi:hypothetical protein